MTVECGHLRADRSQVKRLEEEPRGLLLQTWHLATEIPSLVHDTRKLLIPERREGFPNSLFSISQPSKHFIKVVGKEMNLNSKNFTRAISSNHSFVNSWVSLWKTEQSSSRLWLLAFL